MDLNQKVCMNNFMHNTISSKSKVPDSKGSYRGYNRRKLDTINTTKKKSEIFARQASGELKSTNMTIEQLASMLHGQTKQEKKQWLKNFRTNQQVPNLSGRQL